MLTIKRLADYVGVTVRAVRHYHRLGLLREPPRSQAGYRMYDAQDVITLQRIKVLADAGVPLSRIGDLIEADTATLAEATDTVDAALRRRIEELEETRRRLALLASGKDPFLPPRVVRHLERIEALGVSQETMRVNRDGWILTQALFPHVIEQWLAWQEEALDDPAYRELYLLSDEAQHWDVDDPRIEELARRNVAWITATSSLRPELLELAEWPQDDALAYRLVVNYAYGGPPGWDRLARRVEELLAESHTG